MQDAFKKLARKFHPDLHPGDKEAEANPKDISAANDLLKDEEKRRRFDAGEIDASGAERPAGTGSVATSLAVRPMPRTLRRTDLPITRNWKSFLRARLRAGNVGRRARYRARGQDASYVLPVGCLDVANGSTRTITLPEGKTLQVTVPEGAEDRQMLRLRGQGMREASVVGRRAMPMSSCMSSRMRSFVARMTIFMSRFPSP